MDEQISNQIQKLLTKTKEGKVDWKQINQTAVRWTSEADNQHYIVTLQTTLSGIIVNNKQANQYILTIQSAAGEMLLQLQSNPKTNPEYSSTLEQLFELALTKTKARSADILNKLLDKL